jgi:glutamyl-Q tRNA(Asp) synthetase
MQNNTPSPPAPSAPDPLLYNSPYIGRFAPSPTGPLHFGSLVAALASFLHAHTHHGRWLVRMEDLDPPREQPGAADAILCSLEVHGLQWDGELLFQSQRLPAYEETLAQLIAANLIYPCYCTRQDLQALGGIYNGRCRTETLPAHAPHALRLKLYDTPQLPTDMLSFMDLFQGLQHQNLRRTAGDAIVKRKDGLFAYQLAVVVDDIAQGITHVVRGADLLDVTSRQIALFKLLQAPAPIYGHVPLALTHNGQKLSKQNHAPPLENARAGNNLWQALVFLGQNPPSELEQAKVEDLMSWAITHWDERQLCKISSHQAPPGLDYPPC